MSLNGGFSYTRSLAGFSLVAIALALVGGCKINAVPTPSCVKDIDCSGGEACSSNGTCIQRAARGTWAIEMLPPGDSSAAQTLLAAVNFSSEKQNQLTADAKVTITGDLPEGEAAIGDSHVITTFQTPIPGHSDLQFQTDWLTPSTGSTPPFSLAVPASLIGTNVTFLITPLPPRDLAQPPANIQGKLATANHLMIDHSSWFVTGTLVTPDLNLAGGFVAHALSGGQIVSNNATVGVRDGLFRVEIPKQVAAAAAATSGQPITIEIVPSGSQYSTPRFTTPPITVTANMEVGNLNLPAIGFATLFRFKVAGPDQKPVSGALVRVHTVLGSDESGSSDMVRDGTTDVNGNVDLPLLPNSNGGTQSYDVAVIPPPGSSLGISCVNGIAINGAQNPGGAGTPPVAAQLSLATKATLSGTVTSAEGSAIGGVAIAATRTAVDPASNCSSSVVSSSASGISKPDGTFQLMVDPGTYRLDFDPPAGAAVPRLTQTGVAVTVGATAMGPVGLPSGELVNGSVQGADGTPLSSVDLRLYEIACAGSDQCFGPMRVPPILRAETRSNADGSFQAVVPVQP